MIDILTPYEGFLSSNMIFSISIMIVFIIGTLEIILTLVGFSLSAAFDNIFDIPETPESDVYTFSELFSCINKGRVPLIMLFLTFLIVFGIIGLIIQKYTFILTGSQLSQIIVVPISFIISLPIIRYFSVFLVKIMPRDETTAISRDLFIGNIATITIGEAKKDKPAEAKFKDEFGETHYIMVEPLENKSFKAGETVFISSKKDNSTFYVVSDPNKIRKENNES